MSYLMLFTLGCYEQSTGDFQVYYAVFTSPRNAREYLAGCQHVAS